MMMTNNRYRFFLKLSIRYLRGNKAETLSHLRNEYGLKCNNRMFFNIIMLSKYFDLNLFQDFDSSEMRKCYLQEREFIERRVIKWKEYLRRFF